jgi:hypothetical protein
MIKVNQLDLDSSEQSEKSPPRNGVSKQAAKLLLTPKENLSCVLEESSDDRGRDIQV